MSVARATIPPRARARKGSPPPGTRLESTERRCREILEAALDCFTRLGFDATSMEQIRARAGASIGSIYHHFSSKEELAGALYVEGLSEFQQVLLRDMRRRRGGEALVRGVIDIHLRWVARRPALARWLFHMRRAETVLAVEEEIRALNRTAFRQFFALFDPWVENGELLRLPKPLFMSLLLGPSQEYARAWLAGGTRAQLAEARAVLAEAAWRALRGPRAGRTA